MKLIFAITTLVVIAWADGGMVPPTGDYEIYSLDQVAIIKLRPDTQELSILAKAYWNNEYYGFAWIIPLPNLPSVNSVEVDIFLDLADMTSPYRYQGGCGSFGNFRSLGDGSYGEDYFDVISYDTIGFLQTVLIQTNSPDSLISWLSQNGYQTNQTITNITQDYIDNGWNYFFAARADTNIDSYSGYDNVGIKFRFATDKYVYPMAMTSVSMRDTISVYLYVVGEHKMFFDNAELEYANRISDDEYEAISADLPTLADYIKINDYITKLHGKFSIHSESIDDIYLYQSPDDTEYRKIEYEYADYHTMAMINTPLLPLLFFCGLIINRYLKRRFKKKN
ncbi:hypothetical protein A2Y85_04805 [candidate division WOR-3 bacterium RBG_13_43_14]|uniref:DUF2330 domain-containing protein n=1 Tax=candidate division WOR-3 bacterium RBG_13_43_14 TaxID=1802590 RepID=A0A1F4UC17_UNCW3|nr:MAG: hypothetical protein A2Y85_04805 [candidate division WOR-3 bacterium RBG_13_43_14]